ncbi:MAG: hypothetical protein AB9Q23_06070 [Candidatus Reddybacter sp.]
MLGHTPPRRYVMGEEACEHEASDDEIVQIRQIVVAPLDVRALGFAPQNRRPISALRANL